MDLLVVVGDAVIPPRLAARTRRTMRVAVDDELLTLVADLRGHIPRRVGVLGPGADAAPIAEQLLERGLPIVLHTDDDVAVPGVPRVAVSDGGEPMDAADDLIGLIGNTPMIRLDHTARDVDCHLLAKLELFNPGFSSKDRPALAMIESAELDGRLQPGGTIVEPTSGNTGVGLAIVAARRPLHDELPRWPQRRGRRLRGHARRLPRRAHRLPPERRRHGARSVRLLPGPPAGRRRCCCAWRGTASPRSRSRRCWRATRR